VGKVRPFDAAAHGTVFGDAVGAVVLKRAADADAAADAPLARLLGYAVTNDGARKAGSLVLLEPFSDPSRSRLGTL